MRVHFAVVLRFISERNIQEIVQQIRQLAEWNLRRALGQSTDFRGTGTKNPARHHHLERVQAHSTPHFVLLNRKLPWH